MYTEHFLQIALRWIEQDFTDDRSTVQCGKLNFCSTRPKIEIPYITGLVVNYGISNTTVLEIP